MITPTKGIATNAPEPRGNMAIPELGFVLYGSLVLLPIFLQTLLGYPAWKAVMRNTPVA
jgi:hypothetical protein